MTHYEIIIIYDRGCGEVIAYATKEYMNDSNDIVSHAIKMGLMDENSRKFVKWARAVTKYEFIYVI